jgi:hypothetical protein
MSYLHVHKEMIQFMVHISTKFAISPQKVFLIDFVVIVNTMEGIFDDDDIIA